MNGYTMELTFYKTSEGLPLEDGEYIFLGSYSSLLMHIQVINHDYWDMEAECDIPPSDFYHYTKYWFPVPKNKTLEFYSGEPK